ncbi:hypothetical protein ACFL1S_03525, partial [Pseudomonadota bacterium]
CLAYVIEDQSVGEGNASQLNVGGQAWPQGCGRGSRQSRVATMFRQWLMRYVAGTFLATGAVLACLDTAFAEPWSIVGTCNTTPCTIGVARPGTNQPGWFTVATYSGPQEAWASACGLHNNDSRLFAPDIANGAIVCSGLNPSPNGIIPVSSEHWSIFRNCNTRPCTIGVALPTYSEPDFSRIRTFDSAAKAWVEACKLHYGDPNYFSPDIEAGTIDCGLLQTGNDALLGPWYFGRVNGPLLCNINLTGDRSGYGYTIQSCNPNESFWELRGQELYFMRNDGFVTTIFRRQSEDYWVGPYLGDPAANITHYISRVPPGGGNGGCDGSTYNPYGCN